MGVSLDCALSKRHAENLILGEYVAECIRALGIHCRRTKDRPPNRGSPYGAFRWEARSSGVFGWFHKVCLGLKWEERTSYNPVKMNWLLEAPTNHRIWFLRGLADSDGDVHFKDKSVDITTSPNTEFVKALCDSLDLRNYVRFSRNFSQITIPAEDAARIRIFNPSVLTYRRKILEKLVNAKTFPRHWPSWLKEKVDGLLDSGSSNREICERVLAEDNTFVKMYTLNRKRRKLHLHLGRQNSG